MSSRYEILCMSHDPAIVVLEDASSRDKALEWAAGGLADHPTCDLLVARHSGDIIELGCPPARTDGVQPPHRGHGGWHRDAVWGDADFLRLAVTVLAAAGDEEPNGRIATALVRVTRGCWTMARLDRLRNVLGVGA